MKKRTKIAIGIGSGILLFSFLKFSKMKKAIEQISAKISGIRKVKIDWNTLTVTTLIDLSLYNPTDTAIGLSSAGAVKLKRIAFYNSNNNVMIGEAHTNITGISIPQKSLTTIKDIAVTIPVLTGLLANMELFSSQKELLVIELTITVIGKEYVIKS